jgi:hypothetical protein
VLASHDTKSAVTVQPHFDVNMGRTHEVSLFLVGTNDLLTMVVSVNEIEPR